MNTIGGARWLAVLLVLALMGCGDPDAVETVSVSGKVTLDGEPLADAAVTFHPKTTKIRAPTSYGITDAQGNYVLKVVTNDQDGAMVGMHRVEIRAGDEAEGSDGMEDSDELPDEPYQDPLPIRYNAESELTFDVPQEGSKNANFELKSK